MNVGLRVAAALAYVTLCTLGTWHGVRTRAGAPGDPADTTDLRSHRIVDRHGILLRELPAEAGHRASPLPLEAIGERLLLATLVAEDQNFFEHDGLDRGAILRAASQNLRHGRMVSGASTISQQLVKLLDAREGSERRTMGRKLWEAARAQNLETALSKPAILEAYMNRLPYGRGLVGPSAAARAYFGRSSERLSWAQATALAVLPRAPSAFDPYVHPERVRSRQRKLLTALHAAHLLDEGELARALREPLDLRPPGSPFLAPHWVEMLRAEDRLATRDASTTTTLDLALQRDVEGLVATHMPTIDDRLATNAAAIVVDNATGDVLAYVGSAAFHDEAIAGQVDMVRAPRQPGSAVKPFVFAMAFERGLSPHAMLADVPTTFREGPGSAYVPQNFHRGFLGPIPAREALAASLNVPAVRVASELPAGALLERLHALGVRSLEASADHYGLALALGSGEVELRELAAAYVALARHGQAIELRYTTGAPPALPRPTLSPTAAAATTDALSDPLARARLLGEGHSPFDIGFPVAVKTGTSSGYRDAWAVGYTGDRTVAVWVGNADGRAMLELTGSRGAGPLFADILRRAMREVPDPVPLLAPDLLKTATVCPLSGMTPGPACPMAQTRRVPADHPVDGSCTVHQHARPSGGPGGITHTCDSAAPQVIAVLPTTYEAWLQTHGSDAPFVAERQTQGCTEEPSAASMPNLEIEAPAEGSVYWVDAARGVDRVPLRARFAGDPAARPQEVEFVVDGQPVARADADYQAFVTLPPGDHRVYARPLDVRASMGMPETIFAVR